VVSIFLDLGLRQESPDATRTWLLWAFVPLMNPRPDGMSSQEEFDTLLALDHKMVPAVERACSAVFPGTITSNGRREFYFYGNKCEGLQDSR
jgi:Family of unknown function (DUF695)